MVLHFGIPMNSPNLRIDPVWKTLGMRGTASHDVIIEGHVVPEAAVALKRKAGEWHPLFQIIGTFAIPLIYSVYLGVAESARDIAVKLAKKRRSDHHILQLVGQMDSELLGRPRCPQLHAGCRGAEHARSRKHQSGDDGTQARGRPCHPRR